MYKVHARDPQPPDMSPRIREVRSRVCRFLEHIGRLVHLSCKDDIAVVDMSRCMPEYGPWRVWLDVDGEGFHDVEEVAHAELRVMTVILHSMGDPCVCLKREVWESGYSWAVGRGWQWRKHI